MKVYFNGKEYEIDNSLVAESKTAIVDTLVALEPMTSVTVTLTGMNETSATVTYNNIKYNDNATFTAKAGDEIQIGINPYGSEYSCIYENEESGTVMMGSQNYTFIIPQGITSVSIVGSYDSTELVNYVHIIY